MYVIITDQVNADVIFFKDISLCLDHGLWNENIVESWL